MLAHALHDLLQRIDLAAQQAGRPPPRLVAASKSQVVTAIAELACEWSHMTDILTVGASPAFGENYVQEALDKQDALAKAGARTPGMEWHLIGHLQSNKAHEAAAAFDWVQTLDSAKLTTALGRHRPAGRTPLNVLIQVNIDAEPEKHGCRPDEVATLAALVAAQPTLVLRGLMAIPAPWPEPARRREAFARMRTLFEQLQGNFTQVDTLSMGMSEDFELAIAEGATLVRVGTALFGVRK